MGMAMGMAMAREMPMWMEMAIAIEMPMEMSMPMGSPMPMVTPMVRASALFTSNRVTGYYIRWCGISASRRMGQPARTTFGKEPYLCIYISELGALEESGGGQS